MSAALRRSQAYAPGRVQAASHRPGRARLAARTSGQETDNISSPVSRTGHIS